MNEDWQTKDYSEIRQSPENETKENILAALKQIEPQLVKSDRSGGVTI